MRRRVRSRSAIVRTSPTVRKLRLDILEERQLLSVSPSGWSLSDEPAPVYLPEGKQLSFWDRFLTGPNSGDSMSIAREYLSGQVDELGLSLADIETALITDEYTSADTGTTHIYFAQTYNGLRVANVSLNINISAKGEVINVGSTFVEGLIRSGAVAGPTRSLSGTAALTNAGDELGLSQSASVEIVSQFLSSDGSMTVSAADLSQDDIPLKQIYVPTPNGLVLSWNMILRTPDDEHWLDIGVAAHDGVPNYVVDWVDHASYNVYPRPTEAPNDGSRSIIVDPAMAVPSPYGWHDTNGAAGAEFTDTRGNNVSAQEDADNNDSGGFRPSGGAALNFDFPLDLAQAPSAYQSAAITNLFYWNNLLHDVHYVYGFTEAAGNFQTNNYGRGGLSNDAVQADAQDGSGTNNANFSTPPDGSAPRMQQYIFTSPNPDRDSSIDNQIIVHEYGHGVSNRLTGGPANASALNALQSGGMGEGWSDWWGLMFTQKVTDTKLGGYGVGTYVLNQTTSGLGIRRYQYSYDMSINPLTMDAYGGSGTTSYGTTRSTEVHDTGEIWCSVLWDMNWLLIDKYGFNPNIEAGYTGPGSAGNILALQLVMDALKLQPANPSFLNARDAILLADQNLTGGANQEQIWAAFARRGMGLSAVVTSANAMSVTAATDTPNFGLHVTATTPAVGTVVGTAPTDFTVVLSHSYSAASIQPSDLTVNGLSANSVAQTNSTTLTFHFNTSPVNAQGLQTMAIAGDTILRNSDSDGIDTFNATFRYDLLPLQVTSTLPANGSTVSLPLTTIDVNFNEAFDPSSLGIDDLTVSQGAVVGATAVDADTARYSLSGIYSEVTLTFGIAAGAITDEFGNPSLAYSGSFSTDVTSVPFPTPLIVASPEGSLVYAGSVATAVNFVGDVDSYTITLDAGQLLTVVVDPAATLQPTAQLIGPGNVVLATATAAAMGSDIVLTTTTPTTAGTYTISLSGSAGSTGTLTTHVILNANVEAESHNGATNNSLASAQNLDGSFLALSGSASRTAILGRTEISAGTLTSESGYNDTIVTANNAIGNFLPFGGAVYQMTLAGNIPTNPDEDFFNIGTLQAGDVLTISAVGVDGGRGTLVDNYIEIYRGSSSSPLFVQENDGGGAGLDSLIYRFTITATDTYYIKTAAFHAVTGTYALNLYLEDQGTPPLTGGSIITESEPNDTAASATNVSTNWRAVQYRSQTAGTIGTGDVDYFKYQFSAGDLVSVNVDSLSTLNAKVSLVDATGAVRAIEDGGSSGPGLDSPLYGYKIAASGLYYLKVQAASGTGAYSADVYLSSSVSPPSPSDLSDYYSFTLGAAESVSLAIEGDNSANVSFDLLDTVGTTLVSGNSQSSVDRLLQNFVATTSGTYYVRVTGGLPADYNLVVIRNGVLHHEANDSPVNALPLGPGGVAIGVVGTNFSLARLFAYDVNEGLIDEYDPQTGAVLHSFAAPTDASVGPDFGLATTATTLLAAGDPSFPIYELDPDTGATIRTIPNPGIGVSGLAFANNEIFLLTDAGGAITVLDYVTGQVKRSFQLSTISESLAAGNGLLYSTNGSNTLYELDPQTGSTVLTRTLPTSGIEGLGVIDGELYASTASTIRVIELTTLTQVRTFLTTRDFEAVGADDGGTDDADYFSFYATAGANLSLSTATPGDGDGEFVNILDPMLELYGPNDDLLATNDNGALDGRNALLNYSVGVTGMYRVRVRAAAGSGEYVLTVTGSNGQLPSFAVRSTSPASGPTLSSAPTQIQVDFNDTFLLSTLSANDLKVNGVAATSVTVLDGDSAIFTLPGGLGNGYHTVTMAAGSVSDAQGTPLDAFSMTLAVNVANSAPVLNNSGSSSVAVIDEDSTSLTGTSIRSLLATGAGGDPISDANSGAAEGIAIVGVDSTNGSWEYSLDGGANWRSFGAPSVTSARLLPASESARVRFLPAANFNGAVSTGLTFYAWDQTSGTAGVMVDVSTRGGTTAFSVDSETASILVREINDTPVSVAPPNDVVLVKNDPATSLRLGKFSVSPGGGTDEANQTFTVQILAVPRTQLGAIVRATDLTPVTVGETMSLATFQGLRFLPATGAVGVDALQFRVSDNGTSRGALDPGSIEESLQITVNHKSPISLALDINQTLFGSDPGTAVFLGNVAIFTATTHANGLELWRSDGTAAGTYLLKDINPGSTSSSPANLTVVGSTVYFAANDPTNGTELWKTDGTVAGTEQVVNLNPGANSSSPSSLINFNGTLYFFASGSDNGTSVGNELWKTDGTAVGTVLVKDLVAGSSSGTAGRMAQVGSTLFFTLGQSGGTDIWTTDGTSAGTSMVKNLTSSVTAINLTASGSRVYFPLSSTDTGTELWASDGTSANTGMVKDIFSGTTSSSPSSLIDFGGTLFFSANTSASGTELWKSDGTEAGTVLFKEINPGTGTAVPNNLTVMGGKLYFSATMTNSGNELWVSDGTPAGTSVVKEIAAGVLSSSPSNFASGGTILYFTATTSANGVELWRSDGTAAGTMMVADIQTGATSSSPTNLAASNDRLFFRGNDGLTGRELWTSDGTAGGTQLLADLQPGTASSTPNSLSVGDTSVFFAADNGLAGREFWRSDGTTAQLVVDAFSGVSAGLSATAAIATFGSTTYFAASSSSIGAELWKSDGTPGGTSLLKDINSGSSSSTPANFVLINGVVYFTATTSSAGNELWRTDGTPSGTVLVKDINPGTSGSSPSKLTKVGNQLFFTATTSGEGTELWVSDGTDAGTHLVKDILAGSSSSSINSMSEVGGVLLFSANDGGSQGTELWKSDGTIAGTAILKDIYSGSTSSTPANFLSVGGTLYFRAFSPNLGTELWKSDGTTDGTVLVKDINPGSSSSGLSNLTNVNGTIYFTATTASEGTELWKTDGTAAGTVLVKDTTPGTGSSSFGTFGTLGDRLFFRITESDIGAELWTSDGTSDGTHLVQDILSGIGDSSPANFVALGNKLFFTANDGVHANELFVFTDLAPTATTIPDINVFLNPPDSIIDLFAVFEDDITPDDGLSYSIVGNSNPALFSSVILNPATGALTLDYSATGLGTSTLTLQATDAMHQSVSRSFTVNVLPPPGLKVAGMSATNTGYFVEFDQALDTSVLNLYDQGGTLGAPDATLVGDTVGAVRGSLVVDPLLKRITFIATSGVLAPDSYTLTLRSGVNAFKSATGELLDGNGDLNVGDNYVRTFVVSSPPVNAVTLSIPNFTRGHGQQINLPANGSSGIPITISSGVGVRSATFTLRYDPSLLNIVSASLAPGVTGSLDFNNSVPGTATFTVTSSTQLSSTPGLLTLVNITASVPNDAPYASKEILDLSNLTIVDTSDAQLPAIDDDGIHIGAYFGDANGSQTYNSPDATLAQRVIVGINSGLLAYQMADPYLVVDITANGAIQSNDITLIQRAIVGTTTAQIPPHPGSGSAIAGGPDPLVSIPKNLTGRVGETVTAPVQLLVTEPSGISLSGVDLALAYNAAELELISVQIGQLLLGFGLSVNTSEPGLIRVSLASSNSLALTHNAAGELVALQFKILSGEGGSSSINLRSSSGSLQTALYDFAGQSLTLQPAPTDASDDAVDGLVQILAASQQSARLRDSLIDAAFGSEDGV